MEKYGKMRKKCSERVESRWEYYQTQRLRNATESLFIGKENV